MIAHFLNRFLIFLALAISSPLVAFAQPDDTSSTLSQEVTSSTLTQALTSSTLLSFEYPELEPPRSNYDLLRVQLKRVIKEQKADPSRIGIFVQDCDYGIVPFEWNSQIGFVPGATLKLLTTAAALDILGADYTYKTQVELVGKLSENTFFGDLVVRGSGDPTIGSQAGLNPPDAVAIFHDWANAIKKLGVLRITGSVVADDTCFDEAFEGVGWLLQYRGEWSVAQVSGLSFADNCISVDFKGGKRSGKPTEYALVPQTKHVLFHNGTLTGAKGEPATTNFRRQENSNLINATGIIPAKTDHRARATIHNAPLYFATVLRETLVADKLAVDGPAINIRKKNPETNPTSGSWPVANYVSPPLTDIVRIAGQYGQNFYADMLLKTLGVAQQGQGSFQAGVSVLRSFLKDTEIDDEDCILMDGSGLSTGNSISSKIIGKLLARMASAPNAAAYQNVLSQPGQYGLMQNRFASLSTTDSAAASRIRAISGTISGNYALAGYASTAGGARFAFTFMINDSRLNYTEACNLLDEMAAQIAQSPIRKNP